MRCENILIVEDNADIREVLEIALMNEGYRVYAVNNGKEAVSALKKIPGPSLILLDMMMPVMNGWEFFDIQTAHPEFGPLPVVVVSALGASSALAAKTKSLPAVGYIKKPFDLGVLISLVRDYCDRSEQLKAS
jgi:two-component system chemotaxis response regulator CheY